MCKVLASSPICLTFLSITEKSLRASWLTVQNSVNNVPVSLGFFNVRILFVAGFQNVTCT